MDRSLTLVQSAEQPDNIAQSNLVALLRAGGAAREQGARQLYRLYAAKLKARFQYRYRLPAATSEDLVQETLMRAIDKIDTFRDGRFDVWLWRIGYRLMIDEYRATPATVSMNAPSNDGETPDQLLHALVDTHAVDPALRDCVLRALREFQRDEPEYADILDRIAVDGWDPAAIAQFRDSKEGAARQYVSEGRKRLCEYLQPCLELAARLTPHQTQGPL
jgi:RNA polymerase sigma factor (sigma-70 family)